MLEAAAHPEPDSQWPFKVGGLCAGQPGIMKPAAALGVAATGMHTRMGIAQRLTRTGGKLHNPGAAPR